MARIYFDLHFDECLLDEHLARLVDADGEEHAALVADLIQSGVGFPVRRCNDLRSMERRCMNRLREVFGQPLYGDGYDMHGDLWLYLECPDLATFERVRNIFQPGCMIDAGFPLWVARGLLLDLFPNDPDGHLKCIPCVRWDEVSEDVFNGDEVLT